MKQFYLCIIFIFYYIMNYDQNFNQLSKNDYKRYARHIILPEIQILGQKRLSNAKILFIGAGGLASVTLIYLVSSGVGTIGIVDYDKVEVSNLHRQIIYDEVDIGLEKVYAAKRNLLKINSNCTIHTYNFMLDNHNAEYLIQSYDIIVDSIDNFAARYILSKTCKELHKTHIYGAIGSFEGQISVFNYQGGPSYNDIYTKEKQETIKGCSSSGVLGVLPGLIGMIQATEIIKIITGIGSTLSGKILIYNALKMSFKTLRLRPAIKKYQNKFKANTILPNNILSYLINVNQLHAYLANTNYNLYIIDIRNSIEYQNSHLQYAINIPLRNINKENTIELIRLVAMKKSIIIYCNSIARSYIASDILQKQQIMHWILAIE